MEDTIEGEDVIIPTYYPPEEEKKPKKTKKSKKKVEAKPIIEEEPIPEPKVDVKAIILSKVGEVESLINAISTGSYKKARMGCRELYNLIDKLL